LSPPLILEIPVMGHKTLPVVVQGQVILPKEEKQELQVVDCPCQEYSISPDYYNLPSDFDYGTSSLGTKFNPGPGMRFIDSSRINSNSGSKRQLSTTGTGYSKLNKRFVKIREERYIGKNKENTKVKPARPSKALNWRARKSS